MRSGLPLAWTKRIGFPLVFKIGSTDIPHRSDVGGVELDIADVDALRRAVDRMRSLRGGTARHGSTDSRCRSNDELDRGRRRILCGTPFTPLTIVGTGGTLAGCARTELSDSALSWNPGPCR